MASRNVTTIQAAHEAFNRRDLDAVVRALAPNITYTDQGRGVTLKSPEEFRDWAGEWIRAFSDARVTDARYIDAGDTVIVQFVGRGTNDGPLGPLPATGRQMSVPFCEILHFDAQGRIIRGENYYDQLSILVQLGHAEAPTM